MFSVDEHHIQLLQEIIAEFAIVVEIIRFLADH